MNFESTSTKDISGRTLHVGSLPNLSRLFNLKIANFKCGVREKQHYLSRHSGASDWGGKQVVAL